MWHQFAGDRWWLPLKFTKVCIIPCLVLQRSRTALAIYCKIDISTSERKRRVRYLSLPTSQTFGKTGIIFTSTNTLSHISWNTEFTKCLLGSVHESCRYNPSWFMRMKRGWSTWPLWPWGSVLSSPPPVAQGILSERWEVVTRVSPVCWDPLCSFTLDFWRNGRKP